MRALLLLALLLISAPGGAAPLRLFVSVLPQQIFAEKVGGELVDVRVMVRPGHSPATYDPTPKQIAALSRADLYLRIGVPFEDAWMERIRAANPRMRVLDLRAGLDLVPGVQHHHGDHGQHATDGSKAPALDPHVWTSPRLVKRMAATIRDALTDLAPERGPDFSRGYDAFAAELDELDVAIQTQLKDLPSRTFMVFHPAWGHFAEAYGLRQVAVEREGKGPGGRTLSALIEQARSERVTTVFVQPQFDTKSAEQIARAIGGQVVAIDPLSADYLENLLAIAERIAGAAR